MNLFFTRQLKIIEIYSLPFAEFFVLISTSIYKESKKNILAFGIFIITFVSSIFNSAFYDNILGLSLVLLISPFWQNFFLEKI